jgi:restriction system protein
VRRIVTASAFLVLSSMTAAARPPVEYWLCRSSTGVMGAQDHPCDPSQQTVAAPSSAQIPSQPAPPVQPRPTERPRVNVPAQRPVPIENVFQPIVTMVWKLAFWVIAMLALVTVGKIWLRGRLGKKRRGAAKRTPGTLVGSWPPIPKARSVPGADRVPGPSRRDPTPDMVAHPTEWTTSLLRSLEWKRFEEVCEGVWRANGYTARGTGPGSDGGVDVIIAEHRNPDRVFAVAQCKAWSKPVGVEPVRALWGAKHHFDAQLAIFYSVSGFSTEAGNFAAGKHLKLVPGDELLRQLQTLDETERAALLQHVTRGDYVTPSCPKCEIKMIRKAGRAGRSDFWSCPNFGSCRTRPIAVRGTA